MTADKFKSIVSSVLDVEKPHLSSFGLSALNALARDFSSGKIDFALAIKELQRIYGKNNIDDRVFDEIEKRLARA